MRFFQVLLLLILLIGIILGLFIIAISLELVTYSPSPSIDYGFFVRTIDQDIRVGDLVRFNNPNTDIILSKKLLKRVDKIEGNKLYVKGRTEEELYAATGVEGLVSYDSDFFGWIDIQDSDVEKVRPMYLVNFVYNLLIK